MDTNTERKKAEAIRVIDALGGTTAVSDICGIEPPSVSEWKRKGIPRPWAAYFRLLRPDIFNEND